MIKRVKKLENATENPCHPQGVNGYKLQSPIIFLTFAFTYFLLKITA